ncbi:MBL fold metallo-hydrolase [Acinetobacter sp. HY1485]|uniref:MBL fold metallo-hydrolase n=1 Tax=Acinetobacter sp. HY1485 TaxID=2970918 RepID=UPI0022B9A952|nr:MBL fold metallo-hydrolase [Acinetobacter sp. HY1485]
MLFKQFFEEKSSTYTYLLACETTKQAVLIDPVACEVEKYLQALKGYTLLYTLDTHVHADHITAANLLREQCGSKSVLNRYSDVECGDILVTDGCVLRIGKFEIKTLYTPGHTNSCTSYLVGNMVFTGDALLIDGCGRTDFQHGSAEMLYDSIHNKLFCLPDETIVYPGHDYNGRTASTILKERTTNSRLGAGRSKADFIELMNNLDLPYPKQIDIALPVNQVCGKQK